MSRLMFVYLSGTEKGKTRIFTQDHVTLGTSDACDLKLVPDDDGVLARRRTRGRLRRREYVSPRASSRTERL